MAVGLSLLVTNVSTDLARSVHSEIRSRAVLAHVSEALVAYAVSHPTKPGALPCPDTDNDGLENPIPIPGNGSVSELHRPFALAHPWNRRYPGSARANACGMRCRRTFETALRYRSTAIPKARSRSTAATTPRRLRYRQRRSYSRPAVLLPIRRATLRLRRVPRPAPRCRVTSAHPTTWTRHSLSTTARGR